jgi:predicted O-methyltransferase YrrM
MDRVRTNFAEWGNAILVQGSVPEVLAQTDIKLVAFVHIDMNCALPERAAFDFFWDRLSPGGVILFDDYAYYGHDEQRQSIDDAAGAKCTEVLSLPTGQGLIVK